MTPSCLQDGTRTTFWATIPYNRDADISSRSLNPVTEAPNESSITQDSDLDGLARSSALTLQTQGSNARRASVNSQASTGSKYRSISQPIQPPTTFFSRRGLLEFFGFKRADTFPPKHAVKRDVVQAMPVHRIVPLDDDNLEPCKVIEPFKTIEQCGSLPGTVSISPPVATSTSRSAKKYSANTTASSVSASFDSSYSFASRADCSAGSMSLPGARIPCGIEQLPMSVLLHLDDTCTVAVQKALDSMVDSVTPTVTLNDVLKASGVDTCGQGRHSNDNACLSNDVAMYVSLSLQIARITLSL